MKKASPYSDFMPEFQLIVNLVYEHSGHTVGDGLSLGMRHMTLEMKDQLKKYFVEGVTPANAIASLKAASLLGGVQPNLIADSRVLPTMNQVIHLFRTFDKAMNGGPRRVVDSPPAYTEKKKE
jgi:hypothetical protein